MPWMASAWDAATWFVVETLFTFMTTYFLVRSTGRIWSSIAMSASVMFLRRLSPLTSPTVERFSAAARAANGAQAGAIAASRIMSRRVNRRAVMETSGENQSLAPLLVELDVGAAPADGHALCAASTFS